LLTQVLSFGPVLLIDPVERGCQVVHCNAQLLTGFGDVIQGGSGGSVRGHQTVEVGD